MIEGPDGTLLDDWHATAVGQQGILMGHINSGTDLISAHDGELPGL